MAECRTATGPMPSAQRQPGWSPETVGCPAVGNALSTGAGGDRLSVPGDLSPAGPQDSKGGCDTAGVWDKQQGPLVSTALAQCQALHTGDIHCHIVAVLGPPEAINSGQKQEVMRSCHQEDFTSGTSQLCPSAKARALWPVTCTGMGRGQPPAAPRTNRPEDTSALQPGVKAHGHC